jgi:hypothetical protein
MRHAGTIGALAVVLALTGCSDAEPDVGSSTTSTTTPTRTTVAAGPVTITVGKPSTTTVAPAPPSTTVVTTNATTPGTPPAGPWDVWTLVYASLDANAHDRGDAEAVAATVDGGEVLLSDDYPSLNPGYWVVYSGSWGDRDTAGVWCPEDLDPSLTCYPRYLGHDVAQLLDGGAAIAQVDGRLVALDVSTGEVLATFDDNFHNEGEFPGRFNLSADKHELVFSLGWEDSWYSCDSDRGEIRELNLGMGTETTFADGWSPAISPEGRWLAIVAAAECYPDPEVDGWVITPGSQVEVYDLTDGDSTPEYVLRPETPPTAYDDPQGVAGVFWDPATTGDLLVTLADGSVRRVRYDAAVALDSAPVEYPTQAPSLAAVTVDSVWFVTYADEHSTVQRVSRSDDGATETLTVDGWITGVAVSRNGEALITTDGNLITPTGEKIAVDGPVNNLAW